MLAITTDDGDNTPVTDVDTRIKLLKALQLGLKENMQTVLNRQPVNIAHYKAVKKELDSAKEVLKKLHKMKYNIK